MGAVNNSEPTSFNELVLKSIDSRIAQVAAELAPHATDEEPLNLGHYMERFIAVAGGMSNRAVDGLSDEDLDLFRSAMAHISIAFVQLNSGNTTVNLDALLAKYADAYAKAGTYLPQEAV